jgi:hypothetical protein
MDDLVGSDSIPSPRTIWQVLGVKSAEDVRRASGHGVSRMGQCKLPGPRCSRGGPERYVREETASVREQHSVPRQRSDLGRSHGRPDGKTPDLLAASEVRFRRTIGTEGASTWRRCCRRLSYGSDLGQLRARLSMGRLIWCHFPASRCWPTSSWLIAEVRYDGQLLPSGSGRRSHRAGRHRVCGRCCGASRDLGTGSWSPRRLPPSDWTRASESPSGRGGAVPCR